MRIGLFVPCFVDAFYPEVGIATLELLERLGVDVQYPLNQTCCGQPLGNSGAHCEVKGAERVFIQNFAEFDYVVAPSASCVNHVRSHFGSTGEHDAAVVERLKRSTYDLTDFLHDVLQVNDFPWAHFPHRVGLHTSCSALRHLSQGSMSELISQPFSKPQTLLEGVKGIEFVKPSRPDECCGFGGTFSVSEEAVSVRLGNDKVTDHLNAGADVIVSGDMSCLMHQQGCASRNALSMRFMHLAQILNGARL